MGLLDESEVKTMNPHLNEMKEDVLYHLGFSTTTFDFKEKFGDVKFVCTGGSANRMRKFAGLLAQQCGIKAELSNLAEKGGRFVLFKVGHVLIVDHGMGTDSLSILLHELIKLVKYAGCKGVSFIRLGTSGGLGIDPGTLVLTTEGVNTAFEAVHEIRILGKITKRTNTRTDPQLVEELFQLKNTLPANVPVIKGKTVCAHCFYEEQARLDGAICTYTKEEKIAYLRDGYGKGVRNFEMEATCFTSLCNMAGVRSAIVCVTLVDRLKGDQVAIPPEEYARLQELPGLMVIALLKKYNALPEKAA